LKLGRLGQCSGMTPERLARDRLPRVRALRCAELCGRVPRLGRRCRGGPVRARGGRGARAAPPDPPAWRPIRSSAARRRSFPGRGVGGDRSAPAVRLGLRSARSAQLDPSVPSLAGPSFGNGRTPARDPRTLQGRARQRSDLARAIRQDAGVAPRVLRFHPRLPRPFQQPRPIDSFRFHERTMPLPADSATPRLPLLGSGPWHRPQVGRFGSTAWVFAKVARLVKKPSDMDGEERAPGARGSHDSASEAAAEDAPLYKVQVQLLCECGWSGCEEAVSLTLAAVEALRRTHRAVLAAGHRLTRVSETQRSAAERREDARALRAESTQLRRRARLERLGRVLVVDDSEPFRGAAASLLGSASKVRLVGVAASGEEAIQAQRNLSLPPALRASLLPAGNEPRR